MQKKERKKSRRGGHGVRPLPPLDFHAGHHTAFDMTEVILGERKEEDAVGDTGASLFLDVLEKIMLQGVQIPPVVADKLYPIWRQ